MKTALLDNLENIVKLSLEKRELYNQLNELEKQIFTKTNENTLLEENLGKLEKQLHIKKKQLHTLELEAGELNDVEKEFRQKADSVHNQKELNAITHELQMVQEKRNEIEDELIQEWNVFERKQNEFENFKKEEEVTLSNNREEVKHFNDLIHELRVKISPMQEQIEAKSKALPEAIRDVYMRIESKKVQNPIAPFYSNMCGACYHTLPPQFVCDIEKNEVSTCLNCYRILYLQTKVSEPEETTKVEESDNTTDKN